MIRFKSLVVIFLLLARCESNSTCSEGYGELDNYFNVALKSIQEEAKSGNGLSGDSFRAIVYFDTITNYSSKVNLGDVITYDSYDDFLQDKESWKKWMANNRCSISNDKFHELSRNILKSTPWISSPPND